MTPEVMIMACKEILIVGRGNAGQRYKDIISEKRPDIKTTFFDIKSEVGSPSYVVISSKTEKHFEDFLRFSNQAKTMLIEKPITTCSEDLITINKFKSINFYTGDQFFYSELVLEAANLIAKNSQKIKSIQVCYHDNLSNITKGKTDSYFYSEDTGGALFTLSHVYLVLAKITQGFDLCLKSVDSRNGTSKNTKYLEHVSANWSIDNKIEITTTSDVSKKQLSFFIILTTSNSIITFDLLTGTRCENETFKFYESENRINLIERCVMAFIDQAKNDQFTMSLNSLELIWRVKACI